MDIHLLVIEYLYHVERASLKINQQVFDIGNVTSYMLDESCERFSSALLAVENVEAYQDVYLIDHMYDAMNCMVY